MDDKKLFLIGKEGYCRGEEYEIPWGSSLTIGRSRDCQVSVRKFKAWLALSPEKRHADTEFQQISGRHVEIQAIDPAIVMIIDKSTNGTFLDDMRISTETLSDLLDTEHTLKIGPETFVLKSK